MALWMKLVFGIVSSRIWEHYSSTLWRDIFESLTIERSQNESTALCTRHREGERRGVIELEWEESPLILTRLGYLEFKMNHIRMPKKTQNSQKIEEKKTNNGEKKIHKWQIEMKLRLIINWS